MIYIERKESFASPSHTGAVRVFLYAASVIGSCSGR